uniref:Uncharacterized protein n=1 Tax=Cacopsylla melanoneura TaxID=428564 RepID=A0A8D8X9S3_9HEMI
MFRFSKKSLSPTEMSLHTLEYHANRLQDIFYSCLLLLIHHLHIHQHSFLSFYTHLYFYQHLHYVFHPRATDEFIFFPLQVFSSLSSVFSLFFLHSSTHRGSHFHFCFSESL